MNTSYKNIFWLLFLMSIFPSVAFSQKKQPTDSLLRFLKTHPTLDTNRVNTLNQLCWQNRNNNLVEAVMYGKESIALATALAYTKGHAEALNFIGVVYRNMGDFAHASIRFYEALALSEKYQIDIQIAYANNNIGDILKFQKKYKEALPYAEKALEMFDKIKDKKGQGFAYVRLGEVHQGLAIYEKAVDAFQRSLQIREVLGDKSSLITSYSRIGTVYSLNKDYESSLEFYQKALQISKGLNDKRSIAGSLDNIAWVYIRMKQFKTAKECALASLKIAEEMNARVDERNAYFTMAHLSESMGSFEEALQYHKKYKTLNDSIDSIEKSTQLAKMQAIYDTKKKEKENDLLKKENELNDREKAEKDTFIALVIAALALTLGGIYFTFRSRQKQVSLNAKVKTKNDELTQMSEEVASQRDTLLQLNESIQYKKTKLEKNIEILLELSKNEAISNGDWQVLATEVTKAVVRALRVPVCQLWYHNFKENTFYCIGAQNNDALLPVPIYVPIFLHVLQSETPLVIEDVTENALVDAASKAYFLQENIGSCILYPNILSEKQKGVLLCAEKTKKTWDLEDMSFMKSMDDEIVIAYQGFRRKQAQEKIEKQNEEIAKKNESLRTTLKLVKMEQKRTDELLLNILPWETAEELRETGTATPKQYELVTVLFTDFKGFTRIAEKLTAQQVIEELNTCFLAFDEICDKHKLEKIKTIGDAYMCAGGLPTANTTNPIDAVNAALEMQQWMNAWAKEKKEKGEMAWEVRLGIHSGEVIAGVIGKNKFAYDIWGDTVNIASRMESSGEIGKINVSGITHALVKHAFQCTYRGKIPAKNKGDIEMYFVDSKL